MRPSEIGDEVSVVIKGKVMFISPAGDMLIEDERDKCWAVASQSQRVDAILEDAILQAEGHAQEHDTAATQAFAFGMRFAAGMVGACDLGHDPAIRAHRAAQR